MAKRALIAVASGGLGAAAWLSAMFGAPGGLLLSYFAPLPLLLVGLTDGIAAVAIAGLAGILVVGLAGGFSAAATFFGVHAAPVCLVVALALPRRPAAAGGWPSPGIILACLAVVSALGLLLFGLLKRGDGGLEAGVRAFVEGFAVAPPGGDAQAAKPLTVFAPLAPVFLGFMAMAWQIMIAVNGVLAQALAARSGRALRPSPRWSAIALPDWLSWPLAGTAAVALVTAGDVAYLAQNAAVALAAPYFFAGIAVVHRQTARTAGRGLWLAVFYLLLVIVFLVMVVVVTGLGIANQWFGWPRADGRGALEKKE
jgi:hypothetical protein